MITQYLRASSAPKLPRPSASSDKIALKASHLEMGITIRQVTNSSGTISYRLEIPARVAGARRLLQFHANAALTCSMLGQRSDGVLFTHYRSR